MKRGKSRPQTPNPKLSNPRPEPSTLNLKPQTANSKPQSAKQRLRCPCCTAACKSPVTDSQDFACLGQTTDSHQACKILAIKSPYANRKPQTANPEAAITVPPLYCRGGRGGRVLRGKQMPRVDQTHFSHLFSEYGTYKTVKSKLCQTLNPQAQSSDHGAPAVLPRPRTGVPSQMANSKP